MGIKKIKIVVVGAGYMVNEHLKVLSKFKNVELSGIFSRTKKKALALKKKYKIKTVFDSLDQMQKTTKADGVLVAISPDNLKKVSKAIFSYPWKCLVEKPIGINYKETLKIYNQSKKSRKKIFVAFNRRYYSSTKNLLKRLSKSPNEKRIVVIEDQQNIINLKKRFNKKILDNFMYVNSVHLIDYLTFLCRGKVIKIQKFSKWKKNSKIKVSCKITFSSGDIAYYYALWNLPGPWSIRVFGSNNSYQLKPLEKFLISKNNSIKFFEYIDKDKDDVKFKPGLKKMNSEFIKTILNKRNNLPNLGDALKTAKLINLIY